MTIAQVELDALPPLEQLVARLRASEGLAQKRDIQLPAAYFPSVSAGQNEPIVNGDDAAAIPDGDGYLLLAAEGMQAAFAQSDPWFAGYCSVMVNVSDVAAMGGRSLAAVDVLFTGSAGDNHRVLAGIKEASDAFGVPIVGGHTGRASGAPMLAVAILGRAQRLLPSSGAQAGQSLLYAVDLRGVYRGRLNFNAATHATRAALQRQLGLLPELAELGLATACKDVSQAGLLGTIAMLCDASGCGVRVNLDAIPKPEHVPTLRWLQSFPSFGYVMCVPSVSQRAVVRRFERHGIACACIGQVDTSSDVIVARENNEALFWSGSEGLTGFGRASAVGHGVRTAQGVPVEGAASC